MAGRGGRILGLLLVVCGLVGVVAGAAGARSVAAGDQVWVNRYNGPGNGVDGARAIGVSPDGTRVFVSGHSSGSGSGLDYASEALDASNGQVVWTRRYNGSGNGGDEASALVVSPNGATVYVTGKSASSSAGFDYVTIAYDASTGAQRWLSRYAGPAGGDDAATAIGVSPDGTRVFVTGASDGGVSKGIEYATESLDAATGARQWVKRYGTGLGGDGAAALAVSPDGGHLVVTGTVTISNRALDWATVSYAPASGAKQWLATFNDASSGDDVAAAVASRPDSTKTFVSGTATGIGGDKGPVTRAYNASTGSVVWATRATNTVGSPDWLGFAVAVRPDGNRVYVGSELLSVGISGYVDGYDAATGAMPPADENGQSLAQFRAIAVSPDGAKLFATGTSYDGGEHYFTDAYKTAPSLGLGGRVWFNTYDGPGTTPNDAYAIAVSPDGSKVYVSGESEGATSNLDYATLAISS